MLDHVLDVCHQAGLKDVAVVVSPAQPEVAEHLDGRCSIVYQREQRGTGHAVAQVSSQRLAAGDVLVINSDQPLLRAATVTRLMDAHRERTAAATLATVRDSSRPDGKVVRAANGAFSRIVEHKDATPEERAGDEINVGLYCFKGAALVEALARLEPNNSQGEYYLTDVFNFLRPVEILEMDDPNEALGINQRIQLARAEAVMRQRVLEALMLGGVTITDPAATYVEVGVRVGQDTVIEPGTSLRGRTVIGEGCHIGPHTEIVDSVIEDGARITHAWLNQAHVGRDADCGPFSKLRPGTDIGNRAHVGSFAELARSRVGQESKVPHFSYLGDTTIGENVNVGAGTVTANYDGVRKHPTVIEDEAFLGVDTMLVAPVRVGRGSKTGAGAVVTRDVPSGATAVGMPARTLRRQSGEQTDDR
jgi:bifunctional UDP-N-acetylglucosamine pyrophosphorylase/glucosamine-1-phosphate N-acetyltransferase